MIYTHTAVHCIPEFSKFVIGISNRIIADVNLQHILTFICNRVISGFKLNVPTHKNVELGSIATLEVELLVPMPGRQAAADRNGNRLQHSHTSR
jgi:hypothetical protein